MTELNLDWLKGYEEGLAAGRRAAIEEAIALIRKTYNVAELSEHGSFVFSEDIVKVIRRKTPSFVAGHVPTGESTGGFLAICECGEAIDDYEEHIAHIKGEK